MEVRTRMAPSPTGNLHLGTAYATLWPYLFARGKKGEFVLRIEDTDQERSTAEFEQNILQGLIWLGFEWDDSIYYQMKRLDLYKKAVQKMLAEGKAYYCFCTKQELDEQRRKQIEAKLPQIYSGKCRNLTKDEVTQKLNMPNPYVIRHKLPEDRGVVEFDDLIHGKVSFDSALLGDMVIMRESGIPLYNFAVVVDDADMGITHVIRGDDHVSNTPKQILFFEAIGKKPPLFAHYPVILNQDRVGKLSKRAGSTSVDDYRKDGYLPEAIINFLAILGWAPSNNQEIWSREELIKVFELKDMNKSAGAWNQQKLDWINGEYIRKMDDQKLLTVLIDFLNYLSGGRLKGTKYEDEEKILKLVPLVRERMKKLSDFIPLTDFIFEKPEYDLEVFSRLKINDLRLKVEKIQENLIQMAKPWKADNFEEVFRSLAEEIGISASDIFQLIRVAVSGQTVTPPLFESIQVLGEEETIVRIKEAIIFLKNTPRV